MEWEDDFQEFVTIVERLVIGYLNSLKCNKRMGRVRMGDSPQRINKRMILQT